jgi:hypothetical protein
VPGLIQDPNGRTFYYQTYPAIFTAKANTASLTSQSISSAVPAAAKSAGFLTGSTSGASGALSFTFLLSGDSTGAGAIAISSLIQNVGAASIGGSASMYGIMQANPVQLITSQTVYFECYNQQGSYTNLYTSSYSW